MSELEVSRAHKDAFKGGKKLSQASNEEVMEDLKRIRIDMELVERIRASLKTEWDKAEANGDNKYSSIHYEEIMDTRSLNTCWRYLMHKNHSIEETLELMKASLIWRKENKADESHRAELVKEFWFYAPMAFTGKDYQDRHIMYVVGRNYRRPNNPIVKPLMKLYCMELLFGWDKEHRNDFEQFVMVFDVINTGVRNMDLDFMSWLVSVRDFLPARIAQIYVVGLPTIIIPLVRLILSWLPEQYRRLTTCGSFEELVEANMASDQLPPEANGCAYKAWLAPLDAIWLKDSEVYQEPEMMKAIEYSIWFHVTEERRKLVLEQQLEFESNACQTAE